MLTLSSPCEHVHYPRNAIHTLNHYLTISFLSFSLNAREYLSKTLNGPDNIHTISELRFDCGPATNSTGITGSSHATGGAAIELGTGSQNDQGDQEKEIKFSNPTPPKSQSSFSRV